MARHTDETKRTEEAKEALNTTSIAYSLAGEAYLENLPDRLSKIN